MSFITYKNSHVALAALMAVALTNKIQASYVPASFIPTESSDVSNPTIVPVSDIATLDTSVSQAISATLANSPGALAYQPNNLTSTLVSVPVNTPVSLPGSAKTQEIIVIIKDDKKEEKDLSLSEFVIDTAAHMIPVAIYLCLTEPSIDSMDKGWKKSTLDIANKAVIGAIAGHWANDTAKRYALNARKKLGNVYSKVAEVVNNVVDSAKEAAKNSAPQSVVKVFRINTTK